MLNGKKKEQGEPQNLRATELQKSQHFSLCTLRSVLLLAFENLR
jgi:hypothetical protein